ncbi:MAG TPA: DUF262 domain-containing HNH endonuclease family protein [Anaerolineales bacterium]|nr:DUF262 domain-containing HNH endonuclease family protein [Anaerolineales bacterium]
MSDMIKSVKQIFSDQIFFVPDYQRGYAWEERQCQDLLDDLDLLSESGRHYTGTIVVCPRTEDASPFLDANLREYKAFDIIDGQQRLTTVVILLKAIHDQLNADPQHQALAVNLCETYLFARDRNGQPFTKLSLNPDSQEFFANNILALHPGVGGATIRSHQRLHEAHARFAAYFAGKQAELGQAYTDWLLKFYGKVINQLRMIFYPVTSELDAGVIFETMNDRGKPLTEMEKVKNHLLYLSAKLELPDEAHPLTRRINAVWKFIHEKLMAANLAGRGNEDQLLRSHWLMAYNYDASDWYNARSIKAHFSLKTYRDRHTDLLNDLLVYLDSLQNAASAYCDVFAPHLSVAFSNFDQPEVRQQIVLWSKKIARQGVRAAYLPLLIALRLKATDGGAAYLKAVQLLEKFTFRVFTLKRTRSNAGQTALFRLGYQFYYGQGEEWLLEEIAQLLVLYSSQDEFAKAWEDEKRNWYDWNGINYFLYEFEHHLAEGRAIEMTWEVIASRSRATSIEHILPQTPTDPAWLGRFSPEKRQRWTNDYANLTLTFDNSKLGNLRFETKKGAPGQKGTYANSPLFVEKDIARYADWDEAALLERRGQIKNWALERWHVEVTPRPEQPRSTIEGMIAYADEYGLGDALDTIHQALRRMKMWPTIRQGLQYRSPHNYRRSMLVIYVRTFGFEIYFYPNNFSAYPGLTAEDTMEILGLNNGYNRLLQQDVPEFIDGLKRLEQRIGQGAPTS